MSNETFCFIYFCAANQQSQYDWRKACKRTHSVSRTDHSRKITHFLRKMCKRSQQTVAKQSHRYSFSGVFFNIYIYFRLSQIIKPFTSDSFVCNKKLDSGFIVNNTILTKFTLIKCRRFWIWDKKLILIIIK